MEIEKRYRVTSAASFCLLVFAASTTADAGWEVIDLHPAGATSSVVVAVSGASQAGYVAFNENGQHPAHASLWSGTAESWVDLHPHGYYGSWINDMSGDQQAGEAFVSLGGGWSFPHAGIWSGTAESWVDLNPAGALLGSLANGISGDDQVGAIHVSWYEYHASLWKGTAESWVDLNPVGAGNSSASAASGGQQVGCADFSGDPAYHLHAGLWTGSADSWVDLNPAGSWRSFAADVSDGLQVGAASYSFGGAWNAGMWSGTAESWVNLNPPGSWESEASGVAGGYQVGYANFDGAHHSVIWSGTAEGFFDLHDLLGAEYSASDARSIDVSGSDIWVAGTAYQGDIRHAVLWHYGIPEPSSIVVALVGGFCMVSCERRQLP